MIHRGPLSQNKLVFLRYFLWMGENIRSAESGWGLFTAVAEAAIICMMGCSIAVFSVPQGGTQWHTACPYMVQHVTVCSPLSLPAAPMKSAMTLKFCSSALLDQVRVLNGYLGSISNVLA